MSQAAAYRQAVSDKGTDESVWQSASRLAVKVQSRIREIHAVIHGEVNEAMVYRWQEAMAELNAVHRKAYVDGDNSAVVAAIAKKCKISGLEVDPRMNARTPFQDASDDELDAEIVKAQNDVKRATAH